MKISEKIIQLAEGYSLDDYETIADLLHNSDNASDKELVASILDNVPNANKGRVELLVKSERSNFLGPKYRKNKAVDDVKIIKNYL